MRDDLRDAEQQMVMHRPWDVADDGSVWEISGSSPDGTLRLERAVAFASREPSGEPAPAAFALPCGDLVPTNWVEQATPLLLVHRDEPSRAHREADAVFLRRREEAVER